MAKLKKNKVGIYTKFVIVVTSRGKRDVTREGTWKYLRTDKIVFFKLRGVYRVCTF